MTVCGPKAITLYLYKVFPLLVHCLCRGFSSFQILSTAHVEADQSIRFAAFLALSSFQRIRHSITTTVLQDQHLTENFRSHKQPTKTFRNEIRTKEKLLNPLFFRLDWET